MPRSEKCEIPKGAGVWREISIHEALPLKGRVPMRCLECHGPVRPHAGAKDRSLDAHFEHLQRHPGCSLGDCFSGSRSVHPHAFR